MFASFHYERIIPSYSDKLNNFASGVLICSTISLSKFGGIPSTPDDLLSFNFLIFFATISGVKNLLETLAVIVLYYLPIFFQRFF